MTNILKSLKKAIISEKITKYNDVHDELGRFAEKGSGKSFASKRNEVLSMDDSDKAIYLIREGAVTKDEMLKRFKAGETDQAVNEYFDIMDKNGAPTPAKETSGQVRLSGDTKDWEDARIKKLSELSGFDGEKASETRKAIKKYTSGAQISESDKKTIDEYIESAPAYDGKMYRGMSFGNDYDEFKARFTKGGSFSLDGQVSSWADNEETARGFAHTVDDGCNSVLITCVQNRTSTPIDYLNGQGEGEVLASSKAQWTVLHQEEVTTNDGHKKLFVTCVEKGERVAKSFIEIVMKYNHNHDKLGRFCSSGQGGSGTELSKYGKMVRTKPAPKKTMKAYKMFAIGDDGKLYPPAVPNPNGVDTPTGMWLDAQAAPVVSQTKTGKDHVASGGKGTGGSAKGTVTLRPGWHCSDLPIARQFGKKTTNVKSMPENYVFAEVEIGMDKSYQEESQKNAYSKDGKLVNNRIGMLTIPEDGYYKMNTNQIETGTREWYICGTMKVGKIITDKEMDEVLIDAGTEPMPRVGGEMTKEKLIKMGVDPSIIKDYKSASGKKSA